MDDDRRDDIEQVRQAEAAQQGHVKRSAAERRKHLKIISAKLNKAKKAKDQRAYGELLRQMPLKENSPAWKRAWDFFYS